MSEALPNNEMNKKTTSSKDDIDREINPYQSSSDSAKDKGHHDVMSDEADASSVIVAEKSRGVIHMEAIKDMMEGKKGRIYRYLLCTSVLVCAWCYALDTATTNSYQPSATSSFGHHAMLSTLTIATTLIDAVSKPFISKIADVLSRPYTYIIMLSFYVTGTVIVASSQTISAYVIGDVFSVVGTSGIQLLNSIIVADLTSLKWRGLITASLASPFIINTWYAGYIVDDILASNWRWGYGMFAIIMPVVIAPAICVMLYLDHKAQKVGKIKEGLTKAELLTEKIGFHGWRRLIVKNLIEVDAFGLIILGFGLSLILLPFSLYSGADHGWRNPSIIAMMIVGGILIITFFIYEIWYAPFPSMPRRIIFNRTFFCCVVIDFFYQFGGIRSTYFSSYVWIVKDWNNRNWTYFNNTLTMSLCVFGVVAGIIQRITHRYKVLQISGIVIMIVGYGLFIREQGVVPDTASLVMGDILIGAGGSFSVVGSRVASEATVKHQDLAMAIAILSLWSRVGGAIAAAISGALWTSKLPNYLREFIPENVPDTTVTSLFSSVALIRSYGYETPIRQGAIQAYAYTYYYLFIPALAVQIVTLVAACLQNNYFLGDHLNSVEYTDEESEKTENVEEWKESDTDKSLKAKLRKLIPGSN